MVRFHFAAGGVCAAAGALILLFGYTMFLPQFMVLAGIAWIIYAAVSLMAEKGKTWARVLRNAARVCLVLVALSFVAVQAMIVSDQSTDSSFDEEYVIALGAGLYGDVPSLCMQARMDALGEYMLRNPSATAVVCGGQGRTETVTEASVFENHLLDMGIDESRIIVEDKSANTAQNMEYAARLISEREGTSAVRAAVITNDFHLWRSKFYARKWGIIPCGVNAPTPRWDLVVQYYLREYFSVIKALLGWDFDI